MNAYFLKLLNAKWRTLATSILIALLVASGSKSLYFNDDYRVFFSDDNPKMLEYEDVQSIYNRVDNVFITIKPTDGVFNIAFLSILQQLTEELWQIPYSTRVDSLTNYQHTYVDEDDLTVSDLIEYADTGNGVAPLSDQQIQQAKAIALNEPALVGRFISPSGEVTALNVTINIPAEDQQVGVGSVADAVRGLIAKYQSQLPKAEIHTSGLIMLNDAFATSAITDLMNLMPLLVLTVLVIMGVMIGTVSGGIASLLVVFLSILAGYGAAGWIGLYLTGPAMLGLYMILTLAIADCVHILSSFYYEMRQNKLNKHKAMLESLKVNFMPVMLTSLTTAIGFLTLNISDVGPFNDLGNIVACGVIAAFLLSVTFLPAIMVILPVNPRRRQIKEDSDPMERLANFTIRNASKLLIFTTIIALALVALMPFNSLNDEFTKYFDESTSIRQASDFSDREIGGTGAFELSLNTSTPNGINSPAFLMEVDQLTQWLRTQPEVRNVNSLSDTIKRLNKTMNQDNPAFYRIPENKDLAAQYLLLYELSLPYGLDLNNQINIDKSATRLLATLIGMDSVRNIEFEGRVQHWIDENITTFSTKPVGTTLMFAYIGQININSSLSSAVIALLLISIILMVALRSFRYGLVSFVPNLLPAGIAFGIWFLLKGQIGIANSIVASMTLGIIVDDTVHFLSKYLYAKRQKAATSEEAVRYAFRSVGKALWVTTVALVAGFSIMAQSTYLPNAEMSLLTCVTIIVALLVDFFLLPPLLLFINRNERKGANS